MTVKARLALGAATSALLMLCSCGGKEPSADLAANTATELDPDAMMSTDTSTATNAVEADSAMDGNEAEAEGHGHYPEAAENAAEGGTANAAARVAVAVPSGPIVVDRFGPGTMVPIPLPPPPPTVPVFSPPLPPFEGEAVRPTPVRPR